MPEVGFLLAAAAGLHQHRGEESGLQREITRPPPLPYGRARCGALQRGLSGSPNREQDNERSMVQTLFVDGDSAVSIDRMLALRKPSVAHH